MTVTRQGFSQVVGNGFAGLGFPADAATVYEFPMEMFLPNSDLTPINENIDKIIYGLTKWEPEITEKGVYAPPKITVTGNDYEEALANANLLFLKNLWADGLPIVPPTEEIVDWILTGTDLPRDTVMGEGKILPRGGIATVEAVAVSLAMAGGRPEYLPVLLTAIEAMTVPEFAHDGMNSTTMSTFPTLIVNGPIAKQIRLNSGYGLLGPDPQHSAGASIGRALRFILQNMGGGVPGVGTMAIYGGMRYTNAVFAEDEEGLPPDWPPISAERGFSAGDNVVSIMNLGGINNMNIMGKNTPREDSTMFNYLEGYKGFMTIPSSNSVHAEYYNGEFPGKDPGLLLIPTGVAWLFSDAGWSKEDVKVWIWENVRMPDSLQVRNFVEGLFEDGYIDNVEDFIPLPLVVDPDDVWIVVAGGEQSGHNYFMQHGTSWAIPQSKQIQLPANWDDLLEQAEEDLGPPPAD